MKGSHFEIIYLLKFFKPIEIIREFGFSKPTVYLYANRLKDAKKKAIELLKKHPKFASLKEEEIVNHIVNEIKKLANYFKEIK